MLGDKRPAPWKGVTVAMIGIASSHFYKPACLLESTEHIRCPGHGARSHLRKQRGMPRPEVHLQPQAGQHGGEKEVNQDQRSWQSCAVNSALCGLCGLSFRPPHLRHAERSAPWDSTGLCRLSLSHSGITEQGLLRGTVILGSRNPPCTEGEGMGGNS